MLLVGFLGWWYQIGWRDTANRLSARLNETYYGLSVPTLVNTFFEPWRRIVSEPGAGLSAHTRAIIDNLISRAVGSSVRLITLIAAGLIMGTISLVGGVILLLWPLLPVIGPGLVVWGLLI